MRLRLTPKNRLKIDPDGLKKILIIRLRRIGDIVMTTPAVHHLRRTFPDAEISYVVESPYADLVSGHPDLDQVLELPPGAGLSRFTSLIQRIRKGNYDAAVDFHGGPRAAWITLLSGARWKIGYKVKYRHFIYHSHLSRSPETGPVHSVENHINLAALLGGQKTNIPRLCIASPQIQEHRKIETFILNSGLSRRKLVTIHVGAGNRFRDWGEANIIQLCRELTALPETSVVMVGAGEETAAAERISGRSRSGRNTIYSLAGRLNLRELAALIARSRVFVGPDSGPMHIAAATETPIVACFGPTLPAHFAPWRSRRTILQTQIDCRPCRQRNCVHGDFRCIRSIPPEKVFRACLKYL